MTTRMKLEEARERYREALEAARAQPSPEAWARLLAAGKALSDAQEPPAGRTARRGRKAPSERDLDEGANEEDDSLAREAEFD